MSSSSPNNSAVEFSRRTSSGRILSLSRDEVDAGPELTAASSSGPNDSLNYSTMKKRNIGKRDDDGESSDGGASSKLEQRISLMKTHNKSMLVQTQSKHRLEEAITDAECQKPVWRALEITLRNFVATATNLAVLFLMFFNRERVKMFGTSEEISSVFKFFIVGNTVVFIYAYISIILSLSHSLKNAIHFLDIIAMEVLFIVGTSAAAVRQVGKKWIVVTSWKLACDSTKRSYDHLAISIGFSFLGFFLLLLICLMTNFIKSTDKSHCKQA